MAAARNSVSSKLGSLEGRLSTHEEICRERMTTISSRLKRLEMVVMSTAGTIIILLLSSFVFTNP